MPLAGGMRDGPSREALLRIADDYENLASYADGIEVAADALKRADGSGRGITAGVLPPSVARQKPAP